MHNPNISISGWCRKYSHPWIYWWKWLC